MVARIATLVLLLSALLLVWLVSNPTTWGDLVMPMVVMGSLATSLLYSLAWGWKGLLMSIAIAFIYAVAAFFGVILWLQSLPPGAGFLAGLAGFGVAIVRGISLILTIVYS
jgi:ABC-type amino acid transport system permease subunit